MLATMFGVLAAVLAGIGLYGILAFATAQRTREIGVRMALGAQRWTVVRLILREILLLTGTAVAVTIPVSIGLTRAMGSQVFQVPSVDVGVYAGAVAIMVCVVCLAGLIPARRVAAIDPAKALRAEGETSGFVRLWAGVSANGRCLPWFIVCKIREPGTAIVRR